MLWDLWMNGDVRKTQNIYYSEVQFALLSLVLKKREERKRRDPNTNAREQAQVRLDLGWEKGPLEAEWREGPLLPERRVETPEACTQIGRSWVLVLDHGVALRHTETWHQHHLHVRHFLSFQFQLKKKGGGETKFSKLGGCQAGVWNN